uniref:Ciliary microtubule inner protein 2A n=1 Tax=Sphenodon punctatus TaxID=8508 RepID=A0A8D0GYW4_SPHPU
MTAPHKHSLFTPDPYYIPGYGGFYPQFRYQIGETYGKTTSRLLTDPSVHKSPHSVLAPLVKPRFIEDFSSRKQFLSEPMDQYQRYIPGYTGEPWEGEAPQQEEIQPPSGPPSPCPPTSPPSCQDSIAVCGYKPVRIEAASLPPVTKTVDVNRYSRLSNLDMPNLIQRKAISGYTGFIPRFTWIMGANYLKGVKEAMNEFDQNQFTLRNPMCSFGERLPRTYWPNNKIYTSSGLIPFYTGFVPSKHNYALTFGNSTRKAYYKECRRERAV